MLMQIIIGLVVVVASFLVYVALKPSEMHIHREIVVNEIPEKIFPYINNSKKSNEWMPWAEVDPQVIMTYSGPDEGVGSTSSWNSLGKMGTGQAVVIESVTGKLVKTQLTYTKPMQMSQLAEISLRSTTGGTRLRWSVTGQNTFMGRLACSFIDLDKLIGGQFEMGLNKLKQIVEKNK